MTTPGRGSLATLLDRRFPLVVPGVPNALTARIAEDAGFDAVCVSGAGILNASLGALDLGLFTSTELLGHVTAIVDAVQLSVVVDGHIGFGNAQRTAHRPSTGSRRRDGPPARGADDAEEVRALRRQQRYADVTTTEQLIESLGRVRASGA